MFFCLSFENFSIHSAQAIRHHFHDVPGEVWRLLNQVVETLDIDGQKTALPFCDNGSASRRLIDQRHLPKNGARLRCFDDLVADIDVDGPLHQNVHHGAFFSCTKYRLSRGGHNQILFVFKEFREIHDPGLSLCQIWKIATSGGVFQYTILVCYFSWRASRSK